MRRLIAAALVIAAGAAVLFYGLFDRSPAASAKTQAERYADALAIAVPAAWAVPGRYAFTDFSCEPVAGVKVWMQRVYLCRGTEKIARTGEAFRGAAYVLQDGTHVDPGELGRELANPFKA